MKTSRARPRPRRVSIPRKESNAMKDLPHLPLFSQGQQCERSLDSHPLRTPLIA